MRATKDSGVDWLGEIPRDWEVRKFRNVFKESSEVNGTEPVGPMLSISSYHGVQVKEYASENLQRDSDQLENYRVVRPHQLAVNTMWLNYGGLGVSNTTGHMSPAYRAYWIIEGLYPRYVHHLMRSGLYVLGYTALLTGVRPNSLQMSRDSLMGFPILLPPLEEQQAIADFLDRETVKIDKLIAKQEILIAMLGERRQAVVTSSITQGLVDRNPLEHSQTDANSAWRQVKIGHLFEVIGSGTTPQSDRDEYYGGAIPWVTTGELRESKILKTSKNVSDLALKEHSALRIFPAGSLVIALYGATIGRLGTLGVSSTVNQACCVLSGPKGVRTRFVYYALLAGRSLLLAEAVGGSQPNISQEAVRQFKILVPPSNQQDLITENLDAETTKIDQLIDVAKNTNQKFLERRQSLISAAVTGKIDLSEGA